jgi:type VI secretion system secreted protein VgrG
VERAASGKLSKEAVMAPYNHDALERRIAMLEQQLLALRQAIEISGGGVTIRTAGSFNVTAGGAIGLAAGSNLTLRSSGAIAVTAGSRLLLQGVQRLELEGLTISLAASKSAALAAGDKIDVKTGSAALAMKKDGTVTIDGKDLTLKASGKIDAKASGDVVLKGSKILQN